ncbi:hypothetical protein [Roseateles sp. MS654]|uniref:hypothetical protein n=1 Tax=Roseateles sp. MS654 TaxID=3412685 RepID=UPI003C2E832D
MIAALNNITTSNGPGAATGQSARAREADVNDLSSTPRAEASAVVSVSPQAVSLAAASAPDPATEEEEFPEPISLIPNLVYAEADSDENGVTSPAERRAYDIVHPSLGERPVEVPPKRVVDAELREYASVANNRG